MFYRIREGMCNQGRSTFTVECRMLESGKWVDIKGQPNLTSLQAANTFVKSLQFKPIYHEVD